MSDVKRYTYTASGMHSDSLTFVIWAVEYVLASDYDKLLRIFKVNSEITSRLEEERDLLYAIAEADLDDRCGPSTVESGAAHLAAHQAYDAWKHKNK